MSNSNNAFANIMSISGSMFNKQVIDTVKSKRIKISLTFDKDNKSFISLYKRFKDSNGQFRSNTRKIPIADSQFDTFNIGDLMKEILIFESVY